LKKELALNRLWYVHSSSKLSQPDLVEQFAGRFESELKTSQTGDCHGEVGYPAGYHAPHYVGHLWEKDPEVTRLV